MMDSTGKRAFLAGVEPFGGLADDTLDALVGVMQRRALADGDLFFSEGDPGDAVFVVESGELEVRKRAEDGTDTLLRTAGSGEVGGVTSMALERPRSATLRARGDAAVWTIPSPAFRQFLIEHAELSRALLAFLGKNLRRKTRQLATLMAGVEDDPRPRVAVFDTKPYDRVHLERAGEGLRWDFFESRLVPDTARLAAGYPVVCVFVNDVIDEDVLKQLAAGGVKMIALRCAGFNNVDLPAAEKLGFAVARVPAYSPHAVAEHAAALILTLNRKLHRAHQRVREGNFRLAGLEGFDLHGRTAGVIGLGKIGRCLAKILRGFGMTVLGFDLYPDRAFADRAGVRYAEIDEVIEGSDIVSLHTPLTAETHHLINEDRIKRMKKGVMLINTSRGALVETSALINGLKSGHIGAAGLDVYEEESGYFFEDRSDVVITDDLLARLLTFPNVLVTSHQAFLTSEALDNIAQTTVGNIHQFLGGGALENDVFAAAR
jgi:D-lactate dehydrogenase